MLSPRAIAVQGLGSGALLTSVQGLLPVPATTRRPRYGGELYYPPVEEDREEQAAQEALPVVGPPQPIAERRPIIPGAKVPVRLPVTALRAPARRASIDDDEEEAAFLLLMLH
jgi:hypothetical protein